MHRTVKCLQSHGTQKFKFPQTYRLSALFKNIELSVNTSLSNEDSFSIRELKFYFCGFMRHCVFVNFRFNSVGVKTRLQRCFYRNGENLKNNLL